jgi:high-affinity iron transporter
MLAALLITFREGLEAALIIGIIFGYLRTTEADHSKNRYVWIGLLSGILLSIATAAILHIIGLELEGKMEQIFEGATTFIAAGVLTWMIFWMRHQSHLIKSSLEQRVRKAALAKGDWGFVGVIFISVFREGVETALFLSAAAFASDGSGMLLGAFLGLIAATFAGYLIYTSTSSLNLKLFFNLTSLLLLFFSAGLVAHGVHEFQEAGLLLTIKENVWDTNAILNENSSLGQLLKNLVGYNGNPSLLEVIAYWGYWILVLMGLRGWTESNPLKKTLSQNV